ncbi:hypothetical protein, partial [Escherichia coli]|uniref:hypothetical protein n=1 Tax=Escherichia coli TaxID=562 RepID=UPI0034D983C2
MRRPARALATRYERPMTTVDTQPQQPARTDEELKAQQRAALRKAALEYHEFPTPGKISVTP